MFAMLVSGFGLLAVALSAIGLYALMSWTVSKRTSEMAFAWRSALVRTVSVAGCPPKRALTDRHRCRCARLRMRFRLRDDMLYGVKRRSVSFARYLWVWQSCSQQPRGSGAPASRR
jgi:hypothetical protein